MSQIKEKNKSEFDYENDETYENFIKKLKVKAPSYKKYFLTIEDEAFIKLMSQSGKKLNKICEEIGIRFYYFGNEKGK